MNTITRKFSDNLRIIWAITAKDIVDAVKNKAILSTILSALFLMVLYKVMPSLSDAGSPPRLALYDAGSSSLVAQLEKDSQIDLREMPSHKKIEEYLGYENTVVLGLVLPADFDQALATNEQIELDGYVDHWVSDAATGEIQSFFEGQLTKLTGTAVRINVESDTVLTQLNSGHAFFLSLGMIVLLSMFGLSITANLMIEEKQTKTLNALLISPASSSQVVIAKALTGLFYCLVAAAVVLAFNVTLVVHWGVVILGVICGSMFTVALGLLLGSIFEVKQQLTLWGFILFQPLLLPVVFSMMDDLVPQSVITVMRWIPTVALGKVFRVSLLGRAPLALFGLELAFVAGCAALVLGAVTWVVRRSDR